MAYGKGLSALGLVLTIVALILLAYGLVVSFVGYAKYAFIFGFFLALVGPAIWLGETPLAIAKKEKKA